MRAAKASGLPFIALVTAVCVMEGGSLSSGTCGPGSGAGAGAGAGAGLGCAASSALAVASSTPGCGVGAGAGGGGGVFFDDFLLPFLDDAFFLVVVVLVVAGA